MLLLPPVLLPNVVLPLPVVDTTLDSELPLQAALNNVIASSHSFIALSVTSEPWPLSLLSSSMSSMSSMSSSKEWNMVSFRMDREGVVLVEGATETEESVEASAKRLVSAALI